ncbi:hypothetical protein F4678DRAFT_439631 [Xylaria arbuscula]|nr:hypothetical protein F4678DRAFT_439631 [Xylaria arbuscula]
MYSKKLSTYLMVFISPACKAWFLLVATYLPVYDLLVACCVERGFRVFVTVWPTRLDLVTYNTPNTIHRTSFPNTHSSPPPNHS